jgi:hypothetical protein
MYSYSPYIRENVDFLKQLAATKSDRKKNALLLQATSDQILAPIVSHLKMLHSFSRSYIRMISRWMGGKR